MADFSPKHFLWRQEGRRNLQPTARVRRPFLKAYAEQVLQAHVRHQSGIFSA
jgi:hypothetical protein